MSQSGRVAGYETRLFSSITHGHQHDDTYGRGMKEEECSRPCSYHALCCLHLSAVRRRAQGDLGSSRPRPHRERLLRDGCREARRLSKVLLTHDYPSQVRLPFLAHTSPQDTLQNRLLSKAQRSASSNGAIVRMVSHTAAIRALLTRPGRCAQPRVSSRSSLSNLHGTSHGKAPRMRRRLRSHRLASGKVQQYPIYHRAVSAALTSKLTTMTAMVPLKSAYATRPPIKRLQRHFTVLTSCF